MKKIINNILFFKNDFMRKSFMLILVIIQICGCDIDSKKLQLVNQSNETLFYKLQVDTFLENKAFLYKITPNETIYPLFVRGSKGAWDRKIKNDSKDSSLHIFIFKTEKINDSIIKNRDYKRLDFRVKDLDSLKWRVEIKN